VTPSAAPPAASRRWAWAPCCSTASRPTTSPGCSPGCATSRTCRSACIPTLGYFTNAGWRFETAITGEKYAELALQWREEGAQIIGGCCGVGPEHIAAARRALSETKPGHERPELLDENGLNGTGAHAEPQRWTDPRGHSLFPLELPDILVEEGVFVPTQGSFLVWKYLFQEHIGSHGRCLDVGSGTGLLAVQLALNGAAHVHAIDIDKQAVDNTLTNAFRNGVADRVSAAAVDLYPWLPEERYDVIVASLYQLPVDPFEQVVTHRPLDYWGRNLIDHLIELLPQALADDGVAYIMQLSIIGQERTSELLERVGFDARVVDYTFLPVPRSVQGEAGSDRAGGAAIGRLPPEPRRRGDHGRVST